VPGVERRVQSESLARRRALSDAVSRLEVAAQPRTRAARDVAAPGRDMDSASLAKTVPTFPLQQQAGAGQAFEAARQGALARSAVPAAANALGLGRNATGATSAASLREELSVPSGCWELRGPDPVGGRLLGVPDSVRLRPDTVATDATWHAAESLDSAAVQTVLKWQLKDPLTVELRVLRPLDSTVVRFRTSVTADQLQRTEMPAGILAAAATRIVCP
jgi:nitroreductase